MLLTTPDRLAASQLRTNSRALRSNYSCHETYNTTVTTVRCVCVCGVCYSENGMHFMSFRFWIGTWITIILLVIVAFDLSFLVRYITRFTEESFAVLISIIFVYEACSKTIEVFLLTAETTSL